jgi:thiol-disulfide isomerase/thioredoxin
MSNLVEVTSPEHFKAELSKDLNRVSVLNFWAPWAEPCKEFNEAVAAEAQRFPAVLFLNVSVEQGEQLCSHPRGRQLVDAAPPSQLFRRNGS